MSPSETRKRFAEILEREGREVVAAKIGCSVSHAVYVAKGERDIGLKLAVAIEEVYSLPAIGWVERPAAPNINGNNKKR